MNLITSTKAGMEQLHWSVLFTLAFVFALPLLSATECVWKSDGTGGWSAATQWEGGTMPSVLGDTVRITGENVTATVTQTDIANFQLVSNVTIEAASSRLVIDTTSDVYSPAVFSGLGQLVKQGISTLNLTTPGNHYRTLLGNLGELVISNGTVQLPNRTAAMGYQNQLELSKVSIWNPGILSLGNSPNLALTKGFWGDGYITNANPDCQIYMYCYDRESPPVFSGRILPQVQLTPYYATTGAGVQYLTGEDTDFDLTLRIFGILGAKKIGMKGGAGSIGTGSIGFRNNYSCLVCLNEENETTDKNVQFFGDAGKATIDAGVRGGVTFTGMWNLPAYTSFGPNYRYNTIVLMGENTIHPNVIAASDMYDQEDRSTVYWRKEGTGIWRFAGDARAILGTIEVRRGTLQFETIAEKGTTCSIGLATRTGIDVWNLSSPERIAENVPIVPYAYRLGNLEEVPLSVTNTFLPTMEYVGSSAGICTTRPFVIDGVGRILSTGASLTLAGASAFNAGENTLVLDGAGTNRFSSVTNSLVPLNVVKRGTGTWQLADDIDVGAVTAENGTLQVGSRYTFYRWTITANNQGYGGKWIASFNGFALMDENSNMVNGSVGANGMATAKNGHPERLEPGEICYKVGYSSTGSRYPSKSFHWLADEQRFEGSAAAIDVTVVKDDPATHPVLYFRPDEGVDVAKYDILADGNTERAVAQWELAGSVDGVNWTPLHTIDDSNMPVMPMVANTWYSTEMTVRGGYDIAIGNTNSTVRATSVCAYADATVEFLGNAAKSVISKIEMDAVKGAGTIKGGKLAATGIVDIKDVKKVPDPVLQYVFVGVADYNSIANWSVTHDGQPAGSGWSLKAKPDGSGFIVCKAGLMVTIR